MSGVVGDMMAVHPHACGEHQDGVDNYGMQLGSPPRMWGTHSIVHSAGRRGRFTPTHVGNTLPLKLDGQPGAVHPHACGEHRRRRAVPRQTSGSPPRMWGTLLRRHTTANLPRFTPTHVGNTTRCRSKYHSRPVHPHACGEHDGSTGGDHDSVGSPPRMWGTPVSG